MTGYLSFQTTKAKALGAVSAKDLCDMLGRGTGLPAPKGFLKQDSLNNLHPKKMSVFEFWLDVHDFQSKDIHVNDNVRLKTRGDSIIVESIAKLVEDNKLLKNNNFFAGGTGVSEGWTDKIMKNKFDSDDEEEEAPKEEGDCAEDDEWD
eukprot:CAMPEP_0168535148 /NCGR_PEP_ID=MMETSP0405-20121227/18464_1 /TAXON_ID=498012 /ORGANISM="Trichosphaerium sp, Strain Am-I-7 wt" /LENGTH=148 /DNA_ID=CAMNT_0008562273 /DNA_START=268 /DNA_END=714 /DNA_ORIENTATION=-